MNFRADVAELADAQVSEACDGDIVEVQVLSSAPRVSGRVEWLALLLGSVLSVPPAVRLVGTTCGSGWLTPRE